MKTKLLKRLREQAKRAIGIVAFIDSRGETVYNIGEKREIELNYGYSAYVYARECNLARALIALDVERRNYILRKIKGKQRERREAKINEKLKNL